VEVVLLTPLLMFFILMLVAFGQQVNGRSAVDGAARDAARAGSLQRTEAAAYASAQTVVHEQLRDICVPGTVDVESNNQVGPGELYQVTVSCRIRVLDMLWLPAAREVEGVSASPVDPYRRSEE
jgi:Flp pilus assembly protein TadG